MPITQKTYHFDPKPHAALASRLDAPVRNPVANRGRKRTRVLIIEDNVDAAESLRDLFLLGDREVEVAYDGKTGIVKAGRFQPDLVMCDIGLPGMDGYQVVRILREDPSLSRSRMVAWTGYSRPEDLRRCTEAGFHATLAKPLTNEQLRRLLADDPT